jgi:UPF0176 protein
MQIRWFQPHDRDRLMQLYQGVENLCNHNWEADSKRRYASCKESLFVAEISEQPIGFAELGMDGEISRFYCDPDFQRSGSGTRLYRAIEAKALELGIERLFTSVDATARAFFKSRGFVITRERQISEHGKKSAIYVMEKSLTKSETFVVATFYHFADLLDYSEMRSPLKAICENLALKGSILLAREGINATIAGGRDGIDALLQYLRTDLRLQNLEHKETYCDLMPFQKMRVRLKKELVKLAVPDIEPSREVGIYVDPKDWNALISDPTVLTIDTRNIYEVEFGTFQGAINPDLDFFHEFPKYVAEQLDRHKHKKIAMFCTGGIRCEKASAYMLTQGFEQVYHLKGGILKYLEEVPSAESLWEGECFVFDERVVL